MAHRSKKKHLKHVHQHEPATPPAKSPVAKAEAVAAGFAKKAAPKRRAQEPIDAAPKVKRVVKRSKGIVRRLAGKATGKLIAKLPRPSELAGRATERIAEKMPRATKVAAKPRKAIARAKARVKARVSRVRSLFAAA